MDVLAKLDETRAAINVLEHPFYQRWSAGELTRDELSCYAGQYRHAVRALARASALAAERADGVHARALSQHATEEAHHEALWEQFATACGAPDAERPGQLAETAECVEHWTAGEDLLEHLAVLYAIEASQPEISRTKLEGLRAHYTYIDEGPATEYFGVHAELDVEHSREAAALIRELMREAADPDEQAERMVRRASDALRGNWSLLDGVQAAAA